MCGIETRLRRRCAECKSTSIYQNAKADWDEETQLWEMSDTNDTYYCRDCFGSIEIEDETYEHSWLCYPSAQSGVRCKTPMRTGYFAQ